MRMPALFTAAVLVTAAIAQDKTPKQQAVAPVERVRELQKERVATLREAAEISAQLALNARLDPREALEDRLAAVKAELDAAEKESERTALRQHALKSLKALEELAHARWQSGRGTQLDELRVKARRLEIEMQLEQAKVTPSKQ